MLMNIINDVLLEASESSGGIADAIPNIKEKLVPSWLSFVTQLLSLAVLVIIIIIFAYKPVKKLLAKRADYIEKEIKDAEENKAIAIANAKQSEEAIIASKKKANEIIENANEIAKKNSETKLEETNKEIARIKLEADKDIERSKQEALEKIHDEMVSVALEASKEILSRNVDSEDNKRLAKDFIENL